jgi:hypothetical protein
MRGPSVTLLLVLLSGIGAGCSKHNPGFELDQTTSSGGATTTTGGSTLAESSSSGEPPTTSGETTSAVTATTTTSGETTTTTTSEPETTTSSESGETSTTGMPPVVTWPDMCDDMDPTRAAEVLADTFLVFIPEDLQCLLDPAVMNGPCQDYSLGLVPEFQLFSAPMDGSMQADKQAGVFAARFEPLMPVFQGHPVPPEAFLAVIVEITVARADGNNDPWAPLSFDVYKMPADSEPWTEGTNTMADRCDGGEATFRCRSCKAPGGTCLAQWNTEDDGMGNHFVYVEGQKLTTAELTTDPGNTGKPLTITLETNLDDLEWLSKDGLVLVPGPGLDPKKYVVLAHEAGEAVGPFVSVKHCPPDVDGP